MPYFMIIPGLIVICFEGTHDCTMSRKTFVKEVHASSRDPSVKKSQL